MVVVLSFVQVVLGMTIFCNITIHVVIFFSFNARINLIPVLIVEMISIRLGKICNCRRIIIIQFFCKRTVKCSNVLHVSILTMTLRCTNCIEFKSVGIIQRIASAKVVSPCVGPGFINKPITCLADYCTTKSKFITNETRVIINRGL